MCIGGSRILQHDLYLVDMGVCVDPTPSYNIQDVDALVSGRLVTWLA